MSNETSGNSEKRGPGRPKGAEPSMVLSIRLPVSLIAKVDYYAWLQGISRNRTAIELLEIALQHQDSNYNPQTGEHAW